MNLNIHNAISLTNPIFLLSHIPSGPSVKIWLKTLNTNKAKVILQNKLIMLNLGSFLFCIAILFMHNGGARQRVRSSALMSIPFYQMYWHYQLMIRIDVLRY